MSQENVELVLGLQTTEDWAAIVRDDGAWASLGAATAGLFTPDFECVLHLIDAEAATYAGVDQLRAAWLE